MFAVGGEADDREDAAQSRAVEIAPHGKDITDGDQTVDAHVDAHGGPAEGTQIVGGKTAGGAEEMSIPQPCLLFAPGRAGADQKKAQDDQSDPKRNAVLV